MRCPACGYKACKMSAVSQPGYGTRKVQEWHMCECGWASGVTEVLEVEGLLLDVDLVKREPPPGVSTPEKVVVVLVLLILGHLSGLPLWLTLGILIGMVLLLVWNRLL